MSPWLLRIEMARDMMVDKKLLLSEVRAVVAGAALGGAWPRCAPHETPSAPRPLAHNTSPPPRSTPPTALARSPSASTPSLRTSCTACSTTTTRTSSSCASGAGRAAGGGRGGRCCSCAAAQRVQRALLRWCETPGAGPLLQRRGGRVQAAVAPPLKPPLSWRAHLTPTLLPLPPPHPHPPAPAPLLPLPPAAPRSLMADEGGKGEEGGDAQEDDVFLKKIEASMLTQVGGPGRCALCRAGPRCGVPPHRCWPAELLGWAPPAPAPAPAPALPRRPPNPSPASVAHPRPPRRRRCLPAGQASGHPGHPQGVPARGQAHAAGPRQRRLCHRQRVGAGHGG